MIKRNSLVRKGCFLVEVMGSFHDEEIVCSNYTWKVSAEEIFSQARGGNGLHTDKPQATRIKWKKGMTWCKNRQTLIKVQQFDNPNSAIKNLGIPALQIVGL